MCNGLIQLEDSVDNHSSAVLSLNLAYFLLCSLNPWRYNCKYNKNTQYINHRGLFKVLAPLCACELCFLAGICHTEVDCFIACDVIVHTTSHVGNLLPVCRTFKVCNNYTATV